MKAQLHDGGEIALLDAREELPFSRRHLLMASCVPLSRLELLVDDVVPRRAARVVWCDDGDGLAERAATRMSGLGYRDVAVLDGGIASCEVGLSPRQRRTCPARLSPRSSSTKPTPWISAPDSKS